MTLLLDDNIGPSVYAALARVRRPDVRYVRSEFAADYAAGRRVSDQMWLELAGGRGWLAITRDLSILQTREEREALIAHDAGVIILDAGQATSFDMLHFIVCNIETLARIDETEPRPFAFVADASGQFTKQDLTG